MNARTSEAYEKKYIENNCVMCPLCDGYNLDACEIEAEDNYATSHVKCLDCGASWDDIYHVVGITNIEVPS